MAPASAVMAASGSSAGPGTSASSSKAGSGTASTANAGALGAGTGTGAPAGAASGAGAGANGGGGEGEGDDLPGGPIWAELGSKMPQHSGGRPPNAKVNYKRKFQKARARWEGVTQEQVECKKSLAHAVAKQVKLQDEINYLIDMIGSLQATSAPRAMPAPSSSHLHPGNGHPHAMYGHAPPQGYGYPPAHEPGPGAGQGLPYPSYAHAYPAGAHAPPAPQYTYPSASPAPPHGGSGAMPSYASERGYGGPKHEYVPR